MRTLRLLAALAAVAPLGTSALDAPHDGSYDGSPTECQSCHKLHAPAGGTLTRYPSNNDACLTCHAGGYSANNLFEGGWSSTVDRQAVPGTSGDQHNWSGLPTGLGARLPETADMAVYLPTEATPLQCAVCHDVHGKRDGTGSVQKVLAPHSIHTSYRLGVATAKISGGSGNGTLEISGAALGANPAGYQIQLVGPSAFAISHNSTKPAALVTWWNYQVGPGTWTEGAPGVGPLSGKPFTLGTAVTTDDPAVTITFRAGAQPFTGGEYWRFYVSYPFLRAANDLDQLCLDCHRDRHQTVANVSGAGPIEGTGEPIVFGTTRFSHPVTAPFAGGLDADGSADDGNPSNDLKPVGGEVRCTTCHAPHNADSNSLTVDVR